MTNPHTTFIRRTLCVALGATSLAFAGGASAQSYESTTGATYGSVTDQDGITVYGRPYLNNDEHPMLSQSVNYADLDLTTDAGVRELRYRIRQTARDLCSRLGEPPAREQNTTVLPSCQAAARDSTSQQVASAVSRARYYAGYSY